MTTTEIENAIDEALENAFKFQREYKGRLSIVKGSGKTVDDEGASRRFARRTIIMRRDMQQKVIVFHGAGIQITEALKNQSRFDDRKLRITEADHVPVIDNVMWQTGKRLGEIFQEVSGGSITPVVLPAYTGNIIVADPFNAKGNNFSGFPVKINVDLLNAILSDEKAIPIISTMARISKPYNGVNYVNVNADDAATETGIAMEAKRVFICSDKPGVLDKNGKLIPEILTHQIAGLIEDGTIQGGMIAKIEAAGRTAEALGVDGGVVIIDDNILVEQLTDRGRGTLVRKSPVGLNI